MRLDIQSAINLSPFWEGEQLVGWLKEDYAVFEQSVKTGDIAAGMAKIDRNTTIEDLQQWALREYAASGGDINWSGSFVKSYLNSYINRVDTLTDPDSKLKLPIPGGRYYVMPSMVGRRANLPVGVERGEVFIDPDTQTAWVNDQDWIELRDGASYGKVDVPMNERWGIGKILGGADHDDALWVHPFTDYDGERKMLLWRSPNEAGERVILKPSPGSADLPWQTVDGEVVYPGADSRQLPQRADRIEVRDRGLIDLNPQVNDLPEGEVKPQLHDAMRKAAEREAVNAALLGSVCNYQMVYKAVHGTHPPERPAPLEEVIDLKKTGANGSAVANWVWDKRKGLLDSGTPIPRLLAERVSTRAQGAATTDGPHWLDQIEDAVNQHVAQVRDIRDELVAQTRPPQALFDYALERPELVQAGGRLNQKYAGALAAIRQQVSAEKREMTVDDWERARQVAILELNKTPPEDRGRVLIGSIASVYMSKDPGNDGLAWLMGPRNAQGLREAGFAQQTMQEMREIGILSELIPDPSGKGLIQYQVPRPQTDTPGQTIGINGVWRNVFDIMAGQADLPGYDDWDTSTNEGKQSRKAFASRATQKVAEYMQKVGSLELEVREEDWKDSKRKVVYSSRSGLKVGTIDKVDEDRYQVGQRLTITGSLVKDGNLRAMAQPAS